MLTASKKSKLVKALKDYQKRFFGRKIQELDESGTRLMINHFLTNVLGFISLEEVKTEYMIRGTYADYVVQTKGNRHFLVEVKALSLSLSDKHLRQAINYGANEGIEWALLTNGRTFELYKILFTRPINAKKIFSIDLSDSSSLKAAAEHLQYLHKDSIRKKGLSLLWNKFAALEPTTLSGLLFAKQVTNFLKRELKKRYKSKFTDEEIAEAVGNVISTSVDLDSIRAFRDRKASRKNSHALAPPSVGPGAPSVDSGNDS
jgi:hypothetical protein